MTDCCTLEMTNDGPVDWSINWSDWLTVDDVVDEIATSEWAITSSKEDPVQLEIATSPDSPSIDTTKTITKVWLEGGTDKVVYLITNAITTLAGREQSRSFKLKVRDTILIP